MSTAAPVTLAPAFEPTRRDRSSALLVSAVELYVLAPHHDTEEIGRFGELATQLYPAAHPDDRARIGGIVAPRADAPRPLVLAIARDLPEIAGPVILESPVLEPADLADLAALGSDAHRALLARRQHLPAAVAVALARSEVPAVLEQLAANPTLPSDDELYGLITTGARTSPAVARVAVHNEAFAVDLASAFLELDTAGRMRVSAAAEARAVLGAVAPGARAAAPADDTELALDLFDYAVAGEHALYVARLARVLQLETDFVERLISDTGGEPHVLLLKAAGVPDVHVSRILLRGPEAIARSYAEFSRLARWLVGFGRRAAVAILDEMRGGVARPAPRRESATVSADGVYRPAPRAGELRAGEHRAGELRAGEYRAADQVDRRPQATGRFGQA